MRNKLITKFIWLLVLNLLFDFRVAATEFTTPAWSGEVTSPIISRTYARANNQLKFLASDATGSFEVVYDISSDSIKLRRLVPHSIGFVWQGFDEAGEVIGISRDGVVKRVLKSGPNDMEILRLGFHVRAVRERRELCSEGRDRIACGLFVLGNNVGTILVLQPPKYLAHKLPEDAYAASIFDDTLYCVERRNGHSSILRPMGRPAKGIISAEFPGDISPMGYTIVSAARNVFLIWPENDTIYFSRWMGTIWGPKEMLIRESKADEILSSYDCILETQKTEVHAVIDGFLNIFTLDHTTEKWKRERLDLSITKVIQASDIRGFRLINNDVILSYIENYPEQSKAFDPPKTPRLCIKLIRATAKTKKEGSQSE